MSCACVRSSLHCDNGNNSTLTGDKSVPRYLIQIVCSAMLASGVIVAKGIPGEFVPGSSLSAMLTTILWRSFIAFKISAIQLGGLRISKIKLATAERRYCR